MLEQLFQRDLCICLHSISEEHLAGKCYALDYNGTIYSACPCSFAKIKSFNVRIEDQYESIPVSAAEEVAGEEGGTYTGQITVNLPDFTSAQNPAIGGERT